MIYTFIKISPKLKESSVATGKLKESSLARPKICRLILRGKNSAEIGERDGRGCEESGEGLLLCRMGGQRESQCWCYQVRKNMTHLHEEKENKAT